MSEVTVIARAKAQKGRESDVERALQSAAEESRAEGGCVSYNVLRGDDGVFMTVERWAARSDFDQHLSAAHVQKLLHLVVPMLEGPPDIQVLKEI